jgi:hypothetical protein
LPDYGELYDGEANPYPTGWLEPYRNAWKLLKLDAADVEADADL